MSSCLAAGMSVHNVFIADSYGPQGATKDWLYRSLLYEESNSDALMLLRAYDRYAEACKYHILENSEHEKQFCKEHFLSNVRMRDVWHFLSNGCQFLALYACCASRCFTLGWNLFNG